MSAGRLTHFLEVWNLGATKIEQFVIVAERG